MILDHKSIFLSHINCVDIVFLWLSLWVKINFQFNILCLILFFLRLDDKSADFMCATTPLFMAI